MRATISHTQTHLLRVLAFPMIFLLDLLCFKHCFDAMYNNISFSFALFLVHIAYYLRLNASQSDMFFSLSLSIFLSLFFFSCCADLSFMFGFWLFSWTKFDDFYRFFLFHCSFVLLNSAHPNATILVLF